MELNRRSNRQSVQSVFRDTYDSSSFGPIGFISPVSAHRLKGFIGYVEGGEGQNGRITPMENENHARFLGDVVREGIRRLGVTGNTRLSIRTVVRNDAMGLVRSRVVSAGAQIEAQMPADGEYSIVYIGYNTPERELSQEQRTRNTAAIDGAINENGDGRQAIAELARDVISHSGRYTTRIIDGNVTTFSTTERESIYGLLSAFGYHGSAADSIIANGQNIIGLVYQNDGSTSNIVGISITERRTITLNNGQEMNLAEMTDGTVSRGIGARGLYPRLLSDVFRHIDSGRQEISLVYAESNVSSSSLLRTAAMQGRTFSGVLPNHANIRNKNGELELNSLVVTYLTREQLRSSVERLDEEVAIQQAIRN